MIFSTPSSGGASGTAGCAGGGSAAFLCFALSSFAAAAFAVCFPGFRRDVPELLRFMDCFVLASTRTEGVPQSLLQAMAVGVPVVASAVGGIPEVLADGETGLLVPPEDAAALAAALGAVLRHPVAARRRAAAAQALVARRYSRDGCVDRLLALYGELG